MDKIACYHLFNDYSGSPIVLKTELDELVRRGFDIDLYTSRGGILDKGKSDRLHRHHYYYKFSRNKLVTTLRYIYAQAYTFLTTFKYLFNGDVTFYINTILPVGAAIGAKILGRRIVYHYHENAITKGRTYTLLMGFMQWLADEIICVSEYQASLLPRKMGITVVPNSLPPETKDKLKPDALRSYSCERILMVSSLKDYKGIAEFIELAKMLPQFGFTLVLNDTQENIDSYMSEHGIDTSPRNLEIFDRQEDTTQFYNRSSIVVNLSNPDMCVETFGLTALEAMSAGLPVIVPTVGGIAEMVENGVNGFKIGVNELPKIAQAIERILYDQNLYNRLSKGALAESEKYDIGYRIDKIISVLLPK